MWRNALGKTFASLAVLAMMCAVTSAATPDRIKEIIRPTTDFSAAEKYEAMPGGAATSRKKPNGDAFSQSSANLTLDSEMRFKIGNGFFKRLWVSAPSSTQASDGLGPLFNARSCQRCHLKDGRGHPPSANPPLDDAVSMFMRLSVPATTEAERELLASHRATVIGEPTYGTQLQDFAIQGQDAEGHMVITYTDRPVMLDDGTIVTLRVPHYRVEDLKFGPMRADTMMSPRIAPPMIGLGLLEMIDEADLLTHADPDDRDGDGISGKVNRVWDGDAGKVTIGRFGWKAGMPSIRQQSGSAFAGDIGISNPVARDAWGDCTETQHVCRSALHGDSPQYDNLEANEEVLALVTHYSRNLAVPTRRDVDAAPVLQGKRVFYESGCVSCHVPKYVTRTDAARPAHSHQLIWPYTDLLLHDMGDSLADGRPEGDAGGREWRTPPLWGIGLTETVSGHTFFLHDGRARSLLEAILWHGGEAEAAVATVKNLSKADRDALIKFLESL